MKKNMKVTKHVKRTTDEIKKSSKDLDALSADELKERMNKCEERYHAAFKTDSCREIMSSYYEWQAAKRRYYVAIGVCRPNDQNPIDKLAKEEFTEGYENEENNELTEDFNSFV